MFEQLFSALKKALDGVKPWVMVAPWEQGLRVRLGKYVKLLRPGIHLRLLLLDRIFVQGVRVRAEELGRQTVSRLQVDRSKEGKWTNESITFSGNLEYRVTSIEDLYQTMQHPADTIRMAARSVLARAVRLYGPYFDKVANQATDMLCEEMEGRGVKIERLRLAEFMVVKTYRLVGDYNSSYTTGKSLSVDDGV